VRACLFVCTCVCVHMYVCVLIKQSVMVVFLLSVCYADREYFVLQLALMMITWLIMLIMWSVMLITAAVILHFLFVQ